MSSHSAETPDDDVGRWFKEASTFPPAQGCMVQVPRDIDRTRHPPGSDRVPEPLKAVRVPSHRHLSTTCLLSHPSSRYRSVSYMKGLSWFPIFSLAYVTHADAASFLQIYPTVLVNIVQSYPPSHSIYLVSMDSSGDPSCIPVPNIWKLWSTPQFAICA